MNITALRFLVEGINLAQKRGVYSLQEAAVLAQAIAIFTQSDQPNSAENPEELSEDELNNAK